MENNSKKPITHTPSNAPHKLSPKLWLWVFVGLFVIVGVVLIIRSFASEGTLVNGNVSLEGTIQTSVIDSIPEKPANSSKTSQVKTNKEEVQAVATYEYSLKATTGQQYKLDFKQGAPQNIPSGSKVKLKGQKSGDTIKIATNDSSNFSVTSVATLAPIQTTTKVAVVLINFSDNTVQTTTPANIKQDVFGATTDHYGYNYSVNSYYQANSQGRLKLVGNTNPDGDVYGWITLNTPSLYPTVTDCPRELWEDMANKELANNGIDLAVYDHIIYMFPQASTCFIGGIASLPGPISSIHGTADTKVIAHEFGHNLGLTHANALVNCKDQNGFLATTVTINGCDSKEYADPYDVMGDGPEGGLGNYNFFNARHREQMGWLDPASIAQTTTNGEYILQDISNPNNTGLRAIKIPVPSRKSGTTSYYIEYRSGLYNAGYSGILERSFNDVFASNNTQLLSASAPTNTVYLPPYNVVPIGQKYKIDGTNWAIETRNIDGNTIGVKVIFAVTTSSTYDDASCAGMNVADGLASSNSLTGIINKFTGTVTMKNSGTTTWKAADYQLGSINMPTNLWGINNLRLTQDVVPGATATFTYNFTTPVLYAPASFNWRMNKISTGEWFGTPCAKTVVVGSNVDYPATATTPLAPNPPTNLSVSNITANSATINWTPPTVSNINYILYYQSIQKGSTDKALLCPLFASNTSCTLSNLKSGTNYTFTFRAMSNNGFYSQQSQSITFKTTR